MAFTGLFYIAYENGKKEAELKKLRPEFNPYNPDLDITDHGKKSN